MTKRRRWRKILVAVVLAFALLQGIFIVSAVRATRRARKVQSLLTTLHIQSSTYSDAQSRFASAGIPLDDEACSSAPGEPVCQGLGLSIDNAPVFRWADVNWRDTAFSGDALLSLTSLLGSRSLTINMYFRGGTLENVSADLWGNETLRARAYRFHGRSPGLLISKRNLNEGTNHELALSVELSADATHDDPTLANGLDVTCISRILGCRTADQLWPHAPAQTTKSVNTDGYEPY